ncbi:lipocalin-like domain-containing protein (plasmid) [Streptomyces sp. NBC_01340]|nr:MULTISPECIES: lipocalin-like domain-containing protein [unclassified Streptomyces]MCX4460514.1 lipocalin-like domain-containing protein [Streptomyces sp. NBC_01719]MCX4500156.1 lipocalin-like domain-containing protein [Streptomyces sp. NBC_01728]WSI45238.1 lipocalin-like domain-containing protein [Streptomyces sp. NBC_01340]
MTPDELRAALIGTWRLVSYEATSVDDGEVVRPYGEHPLGLIMYTADGYMSAQITTPDRPLFGEQRQEYGTRVARLDGKTLQLAPPAPLSVQGKPRTGVLTWERAEPH